MTTATLDYPLTFNNLKFTEPTLVYLDSEGTPIMVALTPEQTQKVIDDYNGDDGELKPAKG